MHLFNTLYSHPPPSSTILQFQLGPSYVKRSKFNPFLTPPPLCTHCTPYTLSPSLSPPPPSFLLLQFQLGPSYVKRSKFIKNGGSKPYFAEEDILMWLDKVLSLPSLLFTLFPFPLLFLSPCPQLHLLDHSLLTPRLNNDIIITHCFIWSCFVLLGQLGQRFENQHF